MLALRGDLGYHFWGESAVENYMLDSVGLGEDGLLVGMDVSSMCHCCLSESVG